MEQGSEVARLMRQIDLELEAAQRGLYGFAITARHDLINARMQSRGVHILQLIEEGKHNEAQALMNADNWEIEEREKDDETMQNGIREEEKKTGIQKDERKTSA